MARKFLATWAALASRALGYDVDGCTTIAVGRGATLDGSNMASHSNDCVDCDWRMAYVPARDHQEGAMREIFDVGGWSQYPRLIDPKRASNYQVVKGEEHMGSAKRIGMIPQVRHTYALWENLYSLMNEHGLGMGESTCPAYLIGNCSAQGGDALFTIGNLMAVALERCKTARCAIELMGALGEEYGFCGEDPGFGGAGETVTLVDMAGETWVFHMTGGVPNFTGALWAAQRVPDSHVAVVANSFTMQAVHPEDKENFIVSQNLFEGAIRAGLWTGEGPFDFQRILAPRMDAIQYFPGMPPVSMYDTLRMWSVYRKAAPSLGLKATKDRGYYPFSVPVDRKVSHLDVMDWFRDHYEGTEFDMRYGVLAGPYSSPNRPTGGVGIRAVPGQITRAISIPRTTYTTVLQSHLAQPVTWYAPDAAASSVFVPFYASTLADSPLRPAERFAEPAYGLGSRKTFSFSGDAGARPAWWAFDFVANWMELSYQNMSEAYIYPRVRELQREVDHAAGQSAVVAAAAAAGASSDGVAAVSRIQKAMQEYVNQAWWDLAGLLVVRYNDQFLNFPNESGNAQPTVCEEIGYPAFWLQMIGFNDNSWRPTWVMPAADPPMLIAEPARSMLISNSQMLEADREELPAAELAATSRSRDLGMALFATACAALTGIVGASWGYTHGYRAGEKAGQGDAYVKIS